MQTQGLTIHCQCPPDWSGTLFVHWWDCVPPRAATDWPGTAMIPDPERPGWHRLHLEGTRSAWFVVSDALGHQTPDLFRDRDGWLDAQGRWHDSAPACGRRSRWRRGGRPAAPRR